MLYNNKVGRKKRPTEPAKHVLHRELENMLGSYLDEDILSYITVLMDMDIWEFQDPYEAAKSIENEGFLISSHDLEWIENIPYTYNEAVAETQRVWCLAYNVKPLFKAGEYVLVDETENENLKNFINKDGCIYIEKVEKSTAKYFIEDPKKPNRSVAFYAEEIHDMDLELS